MSDPGLESLEKDINDYGIQLEETRREIAKLRIREKKLKREIAKLRIREKKMEDDKKLVVVAAAQAQKAADYVLNKNTAIEEEVDA